MQNVSSGLAGVPAERRASLSGDDPTGSFIDLRCYASGLIWSKISFAQAEAAETLAELRDFSLVVLVD